MSESGALALRIDLSVPTQSLQFCGYFQSLTALLVDIGLQQDRVVGAGARLHRAGTLPLWPAPGSGSGSQGPVSELPR